MKKKLVKINSLSELQSLPADTTLYREDGSWKGITKMGGVFFAPYYRLNYGNQPHIGLASDIIEQGVYYYEKHNRKTKRGI